MLRLSKIRLCAAAALLSVAFSGMSQAQEQPQRRTRGGFGGGSAMLLASPLVQTELKLTDEQKEKIKALSSAYSGLRDLPREERAKKMAEVAAENKKKTDEILNDEQKKRLREITLQTSGTRALSDPAVVKDLALTDDQIAKIKEISETRSAAGTDREAMQKAREERTAKLMALLTEEQKKKLEELKGAKIDTSKLFEGRGRRPGATQ